MSKKIVTYVLTLAMIFSVFFNPALGYATTGAKAPDVTDTAATEHSVGNVPPEIGAVNGLRAFAISHNTVKLKWNKVAGATEYQLYRYNKSKGEFVYIKTVKGTSCTNANLKKSTSYSYKVRACKVKGEKRYKGAFSKTAKCKTNPYAAKVTNVKASMVSAEAVKVTWSKVNGATGYQVYRYSKSEDKYALLLTTKKLYLTNINLKPETIYNYKIRAYTVQDGKKYFGEFSKMVKCKTDKSDRKKVAELAYSKIGSPYKYGAKGPSCFDCSGFVYWVYANADVTPEIEVPCGSSRGMYASLKSELVGYSIDDLDRAQMGDILFFKAGSSISHVGIYYKDGKMIHAANPRKDICIDNVSDFVRWGYELVGIASVLD